MTMRTLISRFNRDERGLYTLELTLLVPMIFGLFLILYVLFNGFHQATRSSSAATTIGDLLSRQTEVNDQYLDTLHGVYKSIAGVKSEYSGIRVTSVVFTSNGAEVAWSASTGNEAPIDTGDNLIANYVPTLNSGSSLLFVETFREFKAPFDIDLLWNGLFRADTTLDSLDGIVFRHRMAGTPRFTSRITNTDHPETADETEHYDGTGDEPSDA